MASAGPGYLADASFKAFRALNDPANRYVGVQVERGAARVRLLEVTTAGQERPLDLGGQPVPDHWEIDPGLLKK